MMYYYYISIMLIMGGVNFFLSLYFMINKIVLYLEFELISFISIKMEYLILIDWLTLMFISIIFFISSMVMLYSIEYMSGDMSIMRFMNIIMMFIMSMILMIISPNLVSILFGWDGLGLVSYCLVIYYQNESSFNSGMITVLTNRIGDIMILMSISLMVSIGSWKMMFLSYLSEMVMFMLLMAAFTKSAQIPFSSWLPLAMAAPTPISSLVHSSTLVTAGVYLMIRFNYIMLNSYLMTGVMFISIMTLFLSGLSANFENDLKKIIALSTLSQLGVMIFCLSLGLSEISFFHLLIHAMFKSVLFMCAGVIIHNMLNNQDIRSISMVTFNMPLISLIFNCSSFSLCGVPFLSGFFSKDMILEMYLMNMFNKFMCLILFISMGLTVSYTMRLMYYSFIKLPMIKIYLKYKSLDSLMSISMIFLYFMAIMMGSMLSWLLFTSKNYIYLTYSLKLMIYYFMVIGMLLGGMGAYLMDLKLYFKLFFNLIKFMMMMWLISMIYNFWIKKILNISNQLIYLMDLGWNEFLLVTMEINYLKKIMLTDLVHKNFLYLLIFVIYIMAIMIC